MSASRDLIHGLPADLDSERFVLGAILRNDALYRAAIEALSLDSFSAEKHRRIWRRIADLYERGERIDRVTVASELRRWNELDGCGGLSYLVSLDDGMPQVPNLDSYVRILREKANRRRIIYACSDLANRCGLGSENLRDIIDAGQGLFGALVAYEHVGMSIADVPSVRDCGGAEVAYIRKPELPCGAVVALTGDAGSGKSTLVTAWARDAQVPVLLLDRENPKNGVWERLERLGAVDGLRLRIWGGWLEHEAPQPASNVVLDWVGTCEPRPLVIVDSLSAFFSGDQNDAAEMRRFLNGCRRVANAGATVMVLHHTGKADTSRDYRGSSDFSAGIDQGFQCSNVGDNGRLGRLSLRCFKSRFGFSGTLAYDYDGGRFVRYDAQRAGQTVAEQLTAILRLNPNVNGKEFEELAKARGIGRNQAREFLSAGIASNSIQARPGAKNAMHYLLQNTEAQLES